METKNGIREMKKVFIKDTQIITPLGFDVSSNWEALLQNKTGIEIQHQWPNIPAVPAACIDTDLLNKHFNRVVTTSTPFTKVEKMLILALDSLVEKYGITEETLLILSTTKGNVSYLATHEIQQAYLSELALKIARYFHFRTLPKIISNACVSGVMALSTAKRLIEMNQSSDAYVIAVDEVTEFVLSGFQSFQALSNLPCKPYDESRNGVTLGEAAAAAYLSTEEHEALVEIIGEANINDANHISGPSRTGEGLVLSIRTAMEQAQITEDAIDFISAHGTATLYNDEMEAIAMNRLNLQNIPINSLKGYYGHTLGASGLLESVITIESMRKNQLIASKGFEKIGVSEPIAVIKQSIQKEINMALKTASGFGGCNSAILLKKV